jgi:serine/threonine protein kinase
MTKIESFDLVPGRVIAKKFEVISQLGAGWEGEVYKVREISTKIERAAKLFFPQRNKKNKTAILYAKKLHKLRHCKILIHYHTEENLVFKKVPIKVLVSEYVEGELLSNFVKSFPGKRLSYYQGLHLLHSLVKGIEEIHFLNEYHGDLHQDNIIVNRFGLNFELKLVDMYHWNDSKKSNKDEDIYDLIRIFYDCIGGCKRYKSLPKEVKNICCGLKRSLIRKRFRTISYLREHLEELSFVG